MPDNSDKKFLKYKARILAINGGTPSDPRLPYDIHVGAFRGYADGETILAGTPLMDIIRKEFESTPVSYTISISSTGPGTVSPTGSQSVIRGGSLTVTATPNAGSQIKTFKVDGASQTSPYVFTNVQTNHTVVVEFEPIPVTAHTIVASAGTGGSINPSGNVSVNDGASQVFTIAANSGYEIDDVKVDGASQGAITSYTFSNVVADHTIEATFKVSPTPVVTHKITVVVGANGSISPAGPEVIVNDGASQTFTITPDTDYQIDNVKVDGVQQGVITSYTFSNVTADHTIEASFTHNPIPITYTITTSAGAGGTITPTQSANLGDNVNIVITPNSGYQIKSVLVDGAAQTVTPTGMTVPFNNIDADHTVAAEFEVIPVEVYHVVIADATPSTLTGAGTISPAAGTHDVNVGSSQAVVATPNSGFKIKSFTVDSAEQAIADPTRAFTYTVSGIAADATVNIIVEFEKIPTGNIYSKAYTKANGRQWQEPTATTIVLGDPDTDVSTSIAQIVAGTYSWTSKAQAKSIETFVIAKSVGRITSMKNAIDVEVLNNSFEERSVTIDGVDYWVYNNKSTVGAGNATYTIKGTEA